MIIGVDHIAIAVEDQSESLKRWSEDLGLAFIGTEDVLSEKTSTAFIDAKDTHIELIHPIDGEGPVAQSLAKRGPGMHHICFRTDNIDEEVARLKERGWRFTSDEPRPGAHGTRVIFVHPKSSGGVLIELAEHPAPS